FRRALIDYVLLTPADLETRMHLTDGNIHHVDAIPSQLLWQRPLEELAHYRTPIAQLYLCGAGTHPWGEVSGAPGYNAAHAVLSDHKRTSGQGDKVTSLCLSFSARRPKTIDKRRKVPCCRR